MENQELTPEQAVEFANKALAENKTLRAMLADTAEKIANLISWNFARIPQARIAGNSR